MDVLGRLFQLTLFGLKLTPEERDTLFSFCPSSWESLSSLVQTENARARVSDEAWCRGVWRSLDELTQKHGFRWTYPGDGMYPPRLLEISEPPLILCFQGQPVWLDHELISVVGSREPRRDSIDWMRQNLLPFLKTSPYSFASGGARGIDAFAHELTMLADRPAVCFLPSGILRPYPHQHENLFRRILDGGGVLISGFAPKEPMQKRFFHARNRWIAGISAITLVVEAQRKSGSYLTARMALEEGRSICTIPVSPLSLQGLANLDLLFEGAQMLRDQDDLKSLASAEIGKPALSFTASEEIHAHTKEDDVHRP